jgi:ATP-dependent RNA helicase DDX10/DBP4
VAAETVSLGKQEFVVDSHRREKMLKSKKKMLKYMDQGQKLVFDDDGNAHAIYQLQDEDDFKAQGPVEDLRRQFVDTEASRVREVDMEDKQLAKEKRQEKRTKRKAREREEELERQGMRGDKAPTAQLEGGDDEDPLALLRSLPVAGGAGGDSDESEDERPKKKAKKWFQDDSDDEREKAKRNKNVIEMDREPDTLEDLEALAAGLLEG